MFKELFSRKRYTNINNIVNINREDCGVAVNAKQKTYEEILIDKIVEQLYYTPIYSIENGTINFNIEDARETFDYWIYIKDTTMVVDLGSSGKHTYTLETSSLYNELLNREDAKNKNSIITKLEEIKSWLTYVNRQ